MKWVLFVTIGLKYFYFSKAVYIFLIFVFINCLNSLFEFENDKDSYSENAKENTHLFPELDENNNKLEKSLISFHNAYPSFQVKSNAKKLYEQFNVFKESK